MTFYCSPLAPTHLINTPPSREGGRWRDEGGEDIVVVVYVYSFTHSSHEYDVHWQRTSRRRRRRERGQCFKHKATAPGSPLSSNQFVLARWFMNDQLTTCPPRRYIVLDDDCLYEVHAVRFILPRSEPEGGNPALHRSHHLECAPLHPVMAYHHLGVALEYWKLIRCRFLIPCGMICSGRGFKASGMKKGGRYPSMGILLRQNISFADAICFYAWRISYTRKRDHRSRSSGGWGRRRSRGLISGDSERSTDCKRCANITSLIMHTCCD